MRSSKFFRGTLIVLGLWLLLYTIFVAATISTPILIVGVVFLAWGSIHKFWSHPKKVSSSEEDEDSDDEELIPMTASDAFIFFYEFSSSESSLHFKFKL